MSKIRVHGVGSFENFGEATSEWAKDKTKKNAIQEGESAETAATRIEAHVWAQFPEAPRGTEKEQWRDGCRYELGRLLDGKQTSWDAGAADRVAYKRT